MSLNKTYQAIKTIACIILMIIAIFLIYHSFNMSKTTKTTILSYINNINYTYKVISNDSEELNKPYNIANVKDILVTIDYNFIASDKFNMNHEYTITEELITLRNNEVFKSETNIVKEYTEELTDTNGYKVKELITINYQDYLNKCSNIRHNIEDECELRIYYKLTNEGIYKDNEVVVNNEAFIIVPLSDEFMNIDTHYEETTNELEETTIEPTKNYDVLVIGIILLLIPLIMLSTDYKKIHKIHEHQLKYKKSINELLEKYPNNLIETTKMPRIKSKKITEMESLDELIKLDKKLKKGILVYEKSKYNETLFIIINQRDVWIYKMNIKTM